VPFVGHSAKALPSVREGTRQRKVAMTAFGTVTALCRAPSGRHSAKTGSLPSAFDVALGKVQVTLPSARDVALGKVLVTLPSAFFIHSAKSFF
jgi:hypothetical protein